MPASRATARSTLSTPVAVSAISFSLRIGRDRRAVDDRLVREYRLAAGDAERDIRLRGLLVDHEARNRAFQRSGIEVAIADRAEVQEHRAHRAISRENS